MPTYSSHGFLYLNDVFSCNFDIFSWHIFLDNARIANQVPSDVFMCVDERGDVFDNHGNQYGCISDYFSPFSTNNLQDNCERFIEDDCS